MYSVHALLDMFLLFSWSRNGADDSCRRLTPEVFWRGSWLEVQCSLNFLISAVGQRSVYLVQGILVIDFVGRFLLRQSSFGFVIQRYATGTVLLAAVLCKRPGPQKLAQEDCISFNFVVFRDNASGTAPWKPCPRQRCTNSILQSIIRYNVGSWLV
jgi:hypothetical protein